MTRPAPIIAGIVAALLLLFGAYMGAYYALVSRTVFVEHANGEISPAYYDLNPADSYGPGDQLAEGFFHPADQIDNLVRSWWD